MKYFKAKYLLLFSLIMGSMLIATTIDHVFKTLLRWFDLYLPDSFYWTSQRSFMLIFFWHFIVGWLFSKISRNSRFNLQTREIIFSFFLAYISVVILANLSHWSSFQVFSSLILIIVALIFLLLGCSLKNKKGLKRLLLVTVLILVSHFQLKYTLPLLFQFDQYRTINGNYSKAIDISKIKLYDRNLKEVQLEKDKTYIFDFWFNHCGNCIIKWPKVIDFYKDLSNSKDIELYLINVIDNKGEIKESERLLNKYNIKIKNLYMHNKLEAKFDLEYYPTVMVLKQNELIFRGDIETLSIFKAIILE